jgi:hypothetical protein
MALEKSRFFDSVGDDRTYQADDFAEFFRMLFTDGIRNGGTNLKVLASGTGMTVHVNYGEAFVQGYPYWLEDNNTGLLPLTIGTASLSQPRIDRVILHLDRSLAERKTRCIVKRGTPAETPLPPALTRGNNIYELSLAQIRVNANATKIEQSNITDERYDSDVCGLMNSLIVLDGSEFEAQAAAIIEALANQGYLPIDGKAADSDKLDGVDSSGFAAASHTHTIANVSGLQGALDGKAASNHTHDYAAPSHSHAIADVTGLQTALNGKAASNHTHDYAASSHTHTIANVSGLQTALNGKEPTLDTDRKRKITISTSNPSGGADGDIWIKII